MATSFGRYDHHQANAINNLKKDKLQVVNKNVKFYGIPFTSPSILGKQTEGKLNLDGWVDVFLL